MKNKTASSFVAPRRPPHPRRSTGHICRNWSRMALLSK